MQTRLDKFISESMVISRADAKKLITKSMVTVNGAVVKKSDIKIDTDTDEIKANVFQHAQTLFKGHITHDIRSNLYHDKTSGTDIN